uniref:Uncharacterized protein n=1 Tax=viral metagenome TaxID=1070528 RepID=A0A6C0BME9_9ZZZZ
MQSIPEEILFSIAEYSGTIPEDLSSEYIIREIDNIYDDYPWCYEPPRDPSFVERIDHSSGNIN